MYADDYHGHLPPEPGAMGLDHLVQAKYLNKAKAPGIFHCPKDKNRHAKRVNEPLTENTCSYVYVGGVWQPGAGTNEVPICWDKPENHGSQGLNVLFNDGHVSWLTLEAWQKIRPDN